jgi:peptidyl-prolyl cis-trans isomerase A (cyclophilin A)
MKTTKSVLLLLALFLSFAPFVAAEDEPAAEPATANPRLLMKTSMGDITIEMLPAAAPKTVENFIGLANGTKEWKDPTSGEMVTRPFFDGLTYHRIIPNFMIQGGCPLGNGMGGPGYKFEDEINAKALGLDKIKAVSGGQPAQSLLIRSQQDFHRMVLNPLFKKMGITSQEDLNARREEVQKAVEALTVMDVFANLGYNYDDSLKSIGNTPGTLAMANSGPNTNGSQFFINLVDNAYLNGKHTVFGKVVGGMDVVEKIAAVETVNSKPKEPVKIISIRSIEEE